MLYLLNSVCMQKGANSAPGFGAACGPIEKKKARSARGSVHLAGAELGLALRERVLMGEQAADRVRDRLRLLGGRVEHALRDVLERVRLGERVLHAGHGLCAGLRAVADPLGAEVPREVRVLPDD